MVQKNHLHVVLESHAHELMNFYRPWNHLKTIGFPMNLEGLEVN